MCRIIMQSLTQCVQPCIFFVLQPLLLCEGWGGHPLCLSGDSSVLMDQNWPCSCTAQSSILSSGSVSVTLLWWCEAFPWTIFDSSRSPLFQSGQVFHELVCPLTVVLPKIIFNLTALFSYPVFFWLFLLMLLLTPLYFSDPSCSNCFFLSSLLLSHRSRIYSVTQVFFSSDDVCQGSHWLFQSLLCCRWWTLGGSLCFNNYSTIKYGRRNVPHVGKTFASSSRMIWLRTPAFLFKC